MCFLISKIPIIPRGEVEGGADVGFDDRGEEPWAAVDDSPEVGAPNVGFLEEEGDVQSWR